MFDEFSFLQFQHSLLQFARIIHDDGTVPRDGFFDRLPGDQKKANSFVACLNDNLISSVEKDQGVVREPDQGGLPLRKKPFQCRAIDLRRSVTGKRRSNSVLDQESAAHDAVS